MHSQPLGNGESGCITTREVAAGNWLVISGNSYIEVVLQYCHYIGWNVTGE